MTMQHQLHIQASFQTLMDILDQPDSKETAKLVLKRVGLVTGGVLLGTLTLGPFGLIAGAGMAGSAAAHMKPHGKQYEEMLDFLRSMSFDHKVALIVDLEGLVESTDTDVLANFAKNKDNREKLLNLVTNFLVDSFDYKVPEKTQGKHKKVYDKKGNFSELEDLMNQGGE